MIETYEKVPVQVKAIQVYDDSETRADIIELAGDKFHEFGFMCNHVSDIYVSIHNYIMVGTAKLYKGLVIVPKGWFLVKDSETFLAIAPEDFKNLYKKIWD